MKHLDEKDFEQALLGQYITGKYISKGRWVLDYHFENQTFENFELVNGSLTCSLFQNCTFINVVFVSVHLDDCDFKNCAFKNTTFKNCTTEDIEFTNCTNMPKIM